MKSSQIVRKEEKAQPHIGLEPAFHPLAINRNKPPHPPRGRAIRQHNRKRGTLCSMLQESDETGFQKSGFQAQRRILLVVIHV